MEIDTSLINNNRKVLASIREITCNNSNDILLPIKEIEDESKVLEVLNVSN